MELAFEDCYLAISTRDQRFDGRFYTGVVSTGIFCRPVCPATTPKAENCRFFPSAAAALEAGFRPCLRCRPESAPDSPAWRGVRTTVSRALRLIEQGALDGHNVDQLAERLGVGSRHLRRLFADHVGASPLQVARSKRILTAKRLITDTGMNMTDVALAAGFSSVRQFNHTFQTIYGKRPSDLRRAGTGSRMKQQLTRSEFKSPIGAITLIFQDQSLVYLDFSDNPERLDTYLSRRFGDVTMGRHDSDTTIHRALGQYFDQGGDPFEGLLLDTGGTPFQQSVWRELQKIPTGSTLDYSTLAERVGRPAAVRAAASSNATVSYTHLTLPTNTVTCGCRWWGDEE